MEGQNYSRMVKKIYEKTGLPFIAQGDPAANDRMDAVTSQAIKHYFDLLEKTLRDNNLLYSPAQIHNVDAIYIYMLFVSHFVV